MFIPTIGEFVTPQLVGGSKGYLFGSAIADDFGQNSDWQSGAVLALFLMARRAAADGRDLALPARHGRRSMSSPGSTVAVSRNGRRLLTGWFVFFLIFLYLPSVILLIFSFNSGTVPVFPLQQLHDAAGTRTPGTTRSCATRSCARSRSGSARASWPPPIGILAAYPLARRRFRGRNAITAFSLVPLVVPPIVVAVALLMLFRKGPHPIPLSLWTVLAGHVVISLPYCILLLVPRIASIDVRLEEAAHDLGASAVTTFRRIILPLITPAILSAFLIAFVVSIDEYAIASFLAANSETYPVYLFGQIRQAEHLPPMIPVATVMLARLVRASCCWPRSCGAAATAAWGSRHEAPAVARARCGRRADRRRRRARGVRGRRRQAADREAGAHAARSSAARKKLLATAAFLKEHNLSCGCRHHFPAPKALSNRSRASRRAPMRP